MMIIFSAKGNPYKLKKISAFPSDSKNFQKKKTVNHKIFKLLIEPCKKSMHDIMTKFNAYSNHVRFTKIFKFPGAKKHFKENDNVSIVNKHFAN